jgi:hypothetical protein
MNWRKGLFRLWLAFSLVWVGAQVLTNQDTLCRSYSISALKENKQRAQQRETDAFITRQAEYGQCLKNKNRLIDCDALLRPPKEEEPSFFQDVPSRRTDCFPLDSDIEPDWHFRWEWFKEVMSGKMLWPPVGLLLVGLVLMWIVRGFRKKAG